MQITFMCDSQMGIFVLHFPFGNFIMLTKEENVMKGKECHEIIKNLMREKGISQKELAQKSGIANSSVCRYLSGDRTPRIDVLKNFAAVLSVDVDVLLGQDNTMTPFDSIALSIARHGSELTKEEQEKLSKMILGIED